MQPALQILPGLNRRSHKHSEVSRPPSGEARCAALDPGAEMLGWLEEIYLSIGHNNAPSRRRRRSRYFVVVVAAAAAVMVVFAGLVGVGAAAAAAE